MRRICFALSGFGDNGFANRQIETYTVRSSENWIEDFGSAQLASGRAVVTLDPTSSKS